jgi:D-cysteine desulfhydrase
MLMKIPYPPRLHLAHTPTPLDPLPRFSKKLGIDLYVKRDDLTGAEFTGNKVRKLEFVFADALAKGADTVLTCGAAQSNHCRATAVGAARLGLRCRLLLRTPDPSSPPLPEGNLFLDRLVGAETVWITPDEYRRRDEIFKREALALENLGRHPYVVPEGASNSLGTWGYIRAVEELTHDLAHLPGGKDRPTTIVHATGSGGTTAGLILGVRLFGLNARVVGFNVCDDRETFIRVIGGICESAIATYQMNLSFARDRDIEIVDGYVGKGYSLSRPEELALLSEVARTEGIILEPVYTGKAFFGMVQELSRNRHLFGERVVFIHTGGIFALLQRAHEITPFLSND